MTRNENEKINSYIKEYGLDRTPDRTFKMEWWDNTGHAEGYTAGVDDAYKKGKHDGYREAYKKGFHDAADFIRDSMNGE